MRNLILMKPKKIMIFCFATFVMLNISVLHAQQVTLYDSFGEPRVYIDYDEDAAVFMWDGTPVAYVKKIRQHEGFFSFDGEFLGWYEGGIVYDRNGFVVGAQQGATDLLLRTKTERRKGIQKRIPTRRMAPYFTGTKPVWKRRWSNTSLTELLYFGGK